MLVAMVIAPGAPAWETIFASCSWNRAFSTECGTRFCCSSALMISLFSMLVVPTSTGWLRARASAIRVATASYFLAG